MLGRLFAVASALLLLPITAHSQECFNCTDAVALTDTSEAGKFHTGMQFQYIYRGYAVEDGEEFETHDGEKVADTVLDAAFSYDITDRLSVGLDVPVISKAYTRFIGETKESDRVTDIGDLTVRVGYDVVSYSAPNSRFIWNIHAGVKAPTGDSSDLSLEENPDPGTESSRVRGRDLAFGSGSVDFPFGTTLSFRAERFFGFGAAGYSVHGEGDSSFKYGNELEGALGLGYIVADEQKGQFRVGALARLEDYEKSELDGERLDDSGSTIVYVGPTAEVVLGKSFLGHVDLGFPASREADGSQLLPDYAVHVSATAYF